MKFQELPYSCGPATVRNALRCFGIKMNEDIIRALTGTTPHGTKEEGIIRVFDVFGFNVELIIKSSKKHAYAELDRALKLGHPVILCAENFDHWVLAVAKFKPGQYLIIDPARTKTVKKENLTLVMPKDQFDKFWHHRSDGYYGIIVSP